MLFIYALVVLLFWLVLTVYLAYGRSRMLYLKRVSLLNAFDEPPVVVIVAVRNEETHLAEALQSLLQLQYNPLRILVINDRSTDSTAAILQNFAQHYPQLTVTTVTHLPEGWLGKNHALYTGYQSTTEEWMLFTDADVVFEKDTLQKAMRYAVEKQLDHLTVLPLVQSRSRWLNSMLSMFLALLEIKQKPWDVSKPNSKASLGVGAFNLVRRAAYEKAGTHSAIALRPDDDLKLGERLKAAGCRSDAVFGKGQIGLEWYTSVNEFINGLMKNTFAVFDYNLLKVLVTGVAPLLLLLVLPLPVLFFLGNAVEWGMALAILLLQMILFLVPGGMRTYAWYAFMVPVAGAILIYIMLRSAILTLKRGGIYWRESFYPLKDLKKAR